ncbi:MAG TPA: NUDIX domain-containing protein [Pyrinomonadaceae bacterium]|jgi:ADP-ribose pyrophosphatase YjhB (NUDIX family)
MIQTESAGGVVLDGEGRVLVVSQHGTSWSLPKGHVEEGEAILEAARREIYEESGVRELELLGELGSYSRPRIGRGGGEEVSELKTIHMFLFRTSETELKPVDPDNPEAVWVERDRVAALLTHPKDREFFESVLDVIREASRRSRKR